MITRSEHRDVPTNAGHWLAWTWARTGHLAARNAFAPRGRRTPRPVRI